MATSVAGPDHKRVQAMKPTVFLANLRHPFVDVLSRNAMPLEVDCVKAVMDRELPEVHPPLLDRPQRLPGAIDRPAPDPRTQSDRTWNERLRSHVAVLARDIWRAIDGGMPREPRSYRQRSPATAARFPSPENAHTVGGTVDPWGPSPTRASCPAGRVCVCGFEHDWVVRTGPH